MFERERPTINIWKRCGCRVRPHGHRDFIAHHGFDRHRARDIGRDGRLHRDRRRLGGGPRRHRLDPRRWRVRCEIADSLQMACSIVEIMIGKSDHLERLESGIDIVVHGHRVYPPVRLHASQAGAHCGEAKTISVDHASRTAARLDVDPTRIDSGPRGSNRYDPPDEENNLQIDPNA